MSHIYVSQLSFEFSESNTYHDILVNSGTNIPSLGEAIVSPSHIYVSAINLELPLALVPTETVVNVGTGTQTLEEVIVEAPVPEQPPVIGGGVSQRPRVLGGRPYQKDSLTIYSQNKQEIEEVILVSEVLEVAAKTLNGIDTTVRKPIYSKIREVEIIPYAYAEEKITVVPQSEQAFVRRGKKDEEELLLLGII